MSAAARPIVVTMGDPAGCGPAITRATWQALRQQKEAAFAIIGPPALYAKTGPIARLETLADTAEAFEEALPVLDLGAALPNIKAGTPDVNTAPAILASIEQAVALTKTGQASAVVTNPIAKALLYSAGFKHPGHTEFIAQLCSPPADALRPVMMLVGGGLRVALATIHMPLRDVPDVLSHDLLVDIGKIVASDLTRNFGIARPRLAFTGLNPHAGESGSLGREEVEIINPAAQTLRRQDINISDARPGDTVFHEALQGAFDAVIAMTHDQGLIPVKTLDMWGGVNTTLGLPIIRTSPDHGTAYDAAANGTARPDSLIAAIQLARQMADHANG